MKTMPITPLAAARAAERGGAAGGCPRGQGVLDLDLEGEAAGDEVFRDLGTDLRLKLRRTRAGQAAMVTLPHLSRTGGDVSRAARAG